MSGNYNYLFGPVPSRRLGRSLGIDVTPLKTCSFDCLFCQCGCTTNLVTERDEFVPFNEVCAELERWLAEDGAADFITFAGSGEPTLYTRLGELIDFIKARTDIPVIVLSNGTLLYRPEVREETARADIVKVSLSAWDDESYQTINRPAPDLSFERLLAGERNFRSVFSGQLWVEVFLMEGINADPKQVQQIAEIVEKIHPDKIHLNTAVRPPAEAIAKPVARETMEAFCKVFTPHAEVIASFGAASVAAPFDKLRTSGGLHVDDLVGLIQRHPSTAAQLADLSGVKTEAIDNALASRLVSGELQMETRDGEIYYTYGFSGFYSRVE